MLEELEEAHLEVRKGTWCVFAAVFCQEGFCQDCELPKEGHVEKAAVIREANQILFKSLRAVQ